MNNEKVKFIKTLFNTIFPYDVTFRQKFFDYLENQNGEENLEIIGSLLQLLYNQKDYEQKFLINTVLRTLQEKGISLNISRD